MWASRLTSTGARKYVSLLFMNLMASDGKETSLVPQAAFKPMRDKLTERVDSFGAMSRFLVSFFETQYK